MRKWSGRVGRLTILSISAAAFAGCSEMDDQVAYCVDRSNTIVRDENCDDDPYNDDRGGSGGPYFINRSNTHGTGLKPGAKVTGGTPVRADDPAAREKAGLPPKGSIAGKTGKMGGFGSGGSTGGGSRGGSSGG